MPQLAVPAYFQDLDEHRRLARLGPRIVVLNPDTGPGERPSRAHREIATRLMRRGVQVLWYLHLDYGRRPMREVRSSLQRYAAWYPFRGILLDEVPSDLRGSERGYVEWSVSAARALGARTVALNPGTAPVHVPISDIDLVITFEGPAARYLDVDVQDALRPDAGWRAAHGSPGWAEWHLVHGADAGSRDAIANLAAERGADYAFITPDTMPNPWTRVPRWAAAHAE